MSILSAIKAMFGSSSPKVSCPKCGTVHNINSECKCPGCGLKYKLPAEYDVYIAQASAKSINANPANAGNETESAHTDADDNSGISTGEAAMREADRIHKRARLARALKLSALAVVFSALFLTFVLLFFKDKDALVFNTGEYVNQPVFYHTEDGILRCAFPNDKGCNIGKGNVVSYLSSADGKCVYLTYSGTYVTQEESNYVLRISKFGEKLEKISENKQYTPIIVAGGNNKYLYIMTPKDGVGNVFELSLSIDGAKPEIIAENAREIAVSTSGRYALVSLDDSGTSKLMLYSAAKNELSNPGIKNAHPLSVDNKGEYMIYAKKNTADSTDIVVERSTTERVEIPIFKDTPLTGIIFSVDRRTFALEYSDRTVFYTCGDKDYSISNTYSGSVFDYSFNDNVCHNHINFKEIPKISDSLDKELLPYYYFDKEHKFIYKISKGGTKEPVFESNLIDELKVSENNRVAFVSSGSLYTGKLDNKGNDICRIMDFYGKKLIDITPDGKLVYYTDSDGNMFTVEYGRVDSVPEKVTVDPVIVKYSSNSESLISVSGNTASIIDKNGKSKKLCDGIVPELTVVSKKDLSKFFYVKSVKEQATGTEKRSLYLYSGGKSKLITDKLSDICLIPDSSRLDRTKSYYVDIYDAVSAGTSEVSASNG